MRLIDADALTDDVLDAFMKSDRARDVIKHIQFAPTISPDSLRPKGRWEDFYEGKFDNPLYVCSECMEYALWKTEYDMLFRSGVVQVLSDFCPHCGADMREDET